MMNLPLNKWTRTYNLNDDLMVDLETRIALTSMTYNLNLDAYKLRLEDEKVFNDFLNEC